MSDTDFRTTGNNRASSPQGLADKVQRTGEEVKQRASDAFNATSEVAREKLDELGAAAKETASHAADKMKEQLGAQQHAGADYAMRFAGNIRGAAKAFEQDTPIAARTIEMAADYVEDAASKMRDGSLNDLVDGVTSFARRQPAAFLGLTVLAGFAAVRFLKASSGSSSTAGRSQNVHASQASDAYGSYQHGGARRSS
jgi:hypothetical protein